jgi:hypothetical protein
VTAPDLSCHDSSVTEERARPVARGDEGGRVNWKRRISLALGVFVVIVVLVIMASAFIPRWWAHRVGAQVNGSFGSGTVWGLFYGIVFVFVPLLVVRQAFRKRWTWKTRLWIAIVALVLAAPNLMTLGIVLGNGNAAHAADRTLDVDAPAFKGASLIGALIAVVLFGGLLYALETRRRRGSELNELRQRARAQDRDIESDQ